MVANYTCIHLLLQASHTSVLGAFSVAGMEQLLVLSVSAHVFGLSVEYRIVEEKRKEENEEEEDEEKEEREKAIHTR